MALLRPESAAALTAHRREAIRLAKAQEKAVFDKCTRANQQVPGYAFDELIGKGSFGRVYKGRQHTTNKVVAIKVLDIDEADFHAFGDQKDEQIRDFNREIQILRQAQDSGAQNLNQMIEALPVHSQLWLICEYCPGGSVKTLMRATNDRLSEKYLVVVARELGKALRGLHHAGIMHRDVKAANVLIHESGGIQLCDFGVAATLEGSKDKRRTFIGTLHWMPPELWNEKPEYSDEVDVWGYGCTLYECATGVPPNADLRERQQLKMRMRRLKQPISLPEKEEFSEGLTSLVKFALDPDAASRPSMNDILQHDYLLDTEKSHPTNSLTELVQRYYAWLFSGGQRVSLFMPGGAVAASVVNDDPDFDLAEEWNFSMTQDFEKRISTILEIPDLSDLCKCEDFTGEATPKQPKVEPSSPGEMTATDRANFERRVQRGEGLANIFDQAGPAYEYKTKTDFVPLQAERRISDLPFRAMAEERPTSIASIAIDLGDFDSDDYATIAPKSIEPHIQTVYAEPAPKEQPFLQLADAATIRAKRADSKGPKDPNGLTSRRASDLQDFTPADGVAAHDFAMAQEDWIVRDGKPSLQEAAEITPTAARAPERNTMEWSFASAMSEASHDDPLDSVITTPPSSNASVGSTYDQRQDTKARKHATIEWSFSDAMAEVTDRDLDEAPVERTTPKRPVPLLRTMTQPVTQNEVQDVYDDSVPSRPDTALSFAYSESSHASTDHDPFGLERHADMDDFDSVNMGDAVEHGMYSQTARSLVGMSMNGPGPEENSFSTDFDSLTMRPQYVHNEMIRPDVNEFLPHQQQPIHVNGGLIPFRSNGGYQHHQHQPSRSSVSSRQSSIASTNNFNPNTPGTSLGVPGPASHERTRSTSSSNGTRISYLGGLFPDPKPPSIAALSNNASSDVVARELEKLLGDFKSALDVAGDMLQEELRGRGRRRRDTSLNGLGPLVAGSGSEWEDEVETEEVNPM